MPDKKPWLLQAALTSLHFHNTQSSPSCSPHPPLPLTPPPSTTRPPSLTAGAPGPQTDDRLPTSEARHYPAVRHQPELLCVAGWGGYLMVPRYHAVPCWLDRIAHHRLEGWICSAKQTLHVQFVCGALKHRPQSTGPTPHITM